MVERSQKQWLPWGQGLIKKDYGRDFIKRLNVLCPLLLLLWRCLLLKISFKIIFYFWQIIIVYMCPFWCTPRDIDVHCEVILAIKLMSTPVTSHSWGVGVVRTLIYLSSFQVYTTVFLVVGTILYIRSWNFFILQLKVYNLFFPNIYIYLLFHSYSCRS